MNEHVQGTKLAERLLARREGATMDEIVAATGAPQYNVLRRLQARGYRLRKVKEGRATRYFAEPPVAPAFEATMTVKGQVTVPREIRDRLGLRAGRKVVFSMDAEGEVSLASARRSVRDLFGVLGEPPRRASLQEIDAAIGREVVGQYLRSKR